MAKIRNILELLPLDDAAKRRAGYLTFAGWKARGRGVLKGQKAREWNSRGKALFQEDQTAEVEEMSDMEEEFWDEIGRVMMLNR